MGLDPGMSFGPAQAEAVDARWVGGGWAGRVPVPTGQGLYDGIEYLGGWKGGSLIGKISKLRVVLVVEGRAR